jgi:hypothetical protein
MGNQQPCRIAIEVDNPECTSGGLVRGRVYLVINAQLDQAVLRQNLEGIRLVLDGQERAQITTQVPSEEQHSSKVKTTQLSSEKHPSKVERKKMCTELIDSSAVLVKTEHALVSFGAANATQLQPGQQYEFPFEWSLPPGLPSSVRCVHINDRNECDSGEVSYTLSAYVVSPRSSSDKMRAVTPLKITAGTVQDPPRFIRVDAKAFPIKTALFWSKGNLRFGWEADRDVLTPGSTVTVCVTGENQSGVPVKDFAVRLVETVVFHTEQPRLSRTITRTIASEKIFVKSNLWGPSSSCPNNPTPQVKLSVPMDCRETYCGRLLQIQHSLLVVAETAKDWTTNPKLTSPVRLVRGEPSLMVVPGNASGSASIAVASVPSKTSYFELPNAIAEAEVLVGAAHVADTIVLSQAYAVPEETTANSFRALDELVPIPPPKNTCSSRSHG